MANPVYSPQQLLKSVRGEFIEALMGPRAPSLVDKIATVMSSTSDKENYAWLGEAPAMVEFTDQLIQSALSQAEVPDEASTAGVGYEIINKTYHASLALKRDDLADEKTGGMKQRVRDLAARASHKRDALLVEKLVAGTSDTCYLGTASTGEAFFSATHAARGAQTSTWSNLHTGTGTTTAYCATDIGTAIAGLYNLLDEANEPLNSGFSQIFIVYPPALHKSISEAVSAGIISQTSNVQFADHNVQLIREPRLTGTSAVDYYVGIADAEVKGMIWQDREGVTLEEIGQGSDTWTNLRQVVYAAFMRGRAGYGRPQRLILVNNT